MTKIEEYNAKKAELQSQLEQVNRNIIIAEQNIKQQEAIFEQQFGTSDPVELQKIALQYQEQLVQKEQELTLLENQG